MSSSVLPSHIPHILFNDPEVSEKLMKGEITTEFINSKRWLTAALLDGRISEEFMQGKLGLPFYTAYYDRGLARSAISLEQYFNPDFKVQSKFFKYYDDLVKCVEKNTSKATTVEEQNQICLKQFNKFRSSAMQGDLLYHNVNRRFYLDMLAVQKVEAPY